MAAPVRWSWRPARPFAAIRMTLGPDHLCALFSPHRRARPVLRRTAVVLSMVGTLGAIRAALGQESDERNAAMDGSDPAKLMAVVADGSAEPASRESAADRLIELSSRPDVARMVLDAVGQNPPSKDLPQVLLAAIGRAWRVPARLSHPLLELASKADAAVLPLFMPAVGALRTPEAAHALVGFLAADRPAAVRAAAADALVRMSGRDDLGDDAAQWREWIDRARGFTLQQWDDLLAQGVWRHAQRIESDRRAMAERLTDGYRQLYLALPQAPGDQRARLLSQMLLGTRPELRDLGFEIVSREVGAGKSIDGPVSDAAAQLLGSPIASVRAKAAALVMQLTDASAAPRLARAIVTETDPAAAAQMLLGLARWPDAAGREAALKWLEADPKTRAAAAEALSALSRAGLITSPTDQSRIVAALRQIDPSELTPPACRLLVAYGDDHDRSTVAALLSSKEVGMRLAAADALARRPEFLDAILDAAKTDQGLFASAVRAVEHCRSNTAGYMTLTQLPAPTADDRLRGLLDASASLPPGDLVEVARATPDAALRERLLARLTEHGPEPQGSMHPGDPEAIGQGIILLAQTQLSMKRPDLAAATLDALPRNAAGVDSRELAVLRTVALLWSNRIEDAGVLDAPPSAWIDGLERAIAEPHARAILREIRQRFGPSLSKEEAERVKQLSARISSLPAPTDGQATVPEETESH